MVTTKESEIMFLYKTQIIYLTLPRFIVFTHFTINLL